MLRIPLGGSGDGADEASAGGEGFDDETGVLSLALKASDGVVSLDLPLMGVGAGALLPSEAQGIVAQEAKAVVASVIASATETVIDELLQS